MKHLLSVLLTSLSLIMVAPADAQDTDTGKQRKHPIMKVLLQLDLNQQQKEDIKQILQNGRDDMEIYKEDVKELQRALRELTYADTWDEEEVKEAIASRSALKQDIQYSRARAHHSIWLLLSTEQQQELNSITAKRDDKDADNNERKNRKMRAWERIAPRLNLSDEQAVAIAQIREQFIEENEGFRALSKTHRQQERDIIRADEFNQDAWLALYAEHQQPMLDNAFSKVSMQHQIYLVLDDAQREKMRKLERFMKSKKKQKRRS